MHPYFIIEKNQFQEQSEGKEKTEEKPLVGFRETPEKATKKAWILQGFSLLFIEFCFSLKRPCFFP